MRGRFAALPVGTRGRSAKKSPARAGSTREALGWVQRNLQTGDANHLASEWKYLFQTVVLYKARFLFFFFSPCQAFWRARAGLWSSAGMCCI